MTDTNATQATEVATTEEVQAQPKPAAKKKARTRRKPAAKRSTKRVAPEPKTGSKKAPAKKATPKKERVPAVTLANAEASAVIENRLGEEINQFFVLTKSQKQNAIGAIKTAALRQINALAKKEREKAVNVFASLHNGKSPSVYTVLAIQHLASEGSSTITGLRDMYLNTGYKSGTARRHAQMMAGVLPAIKVATRDGKNLSFNPDSTIAQAVMEQVKAESA